MFLRSLSHAHESLFFLSLSLLLFVHTRIESSQATIEIYLQYMYFYLASLYTYICSLTRFSMYFICELFRWPAVYVCVCEEQRKCQHSTVAVAVLEVGGRGVPTPRLPPRRSTLGTKSWLVRQSQRQSAGLWVFKDTRKYNHIPAYTHSQTLQHL